MQLVQRAPSLALAVKLLLATHFLPENVDHGLNHKGYGTEEKKDREGELVRECFEPLLRDRLAPAVDYFDRKARVVKRARRK